MIGWVQVPGFKNPISYPVMQANDNEFYLNNDFYKNFSYAGSIFIDHRNNASQVDSHIILYGHAMNNLSMFGNFKKFPDRPDDYTKIRKVYLDLMNTRLEYEIFSTYYESASYNYRQTNFSSDDEYLEFLNRIQSKSVYDFNIKLTAQDKIITLSTCNNNLPGDMRSVTHAKLVRQIVYTPGTATSSGAISAGDASDGGIYSDADKGIVSANNYLSELSLYYGDRKKPTKAVFTPPFSTDVNSVHKVFSTELPKEVDTVFLLYKTNDPEATVSVTFNDKKADPSSIKLADGQNIIKITVTSRDKLYKRVHTINVIRAESTPGTGSTAGMGSTPATGSDPESGSLPEATPVTGSDNAPEKSGNTGKGAEQDSNTESETVSQPSTGTGSGAEPQSSANTGSATQP
jgi:SrtB family sortase